MLFFFFKEKTAYEMRISDWSSDVCSSDLLDPLPIALLTDDPAALLTLHRGASHSLFVLPLAGWLVWAFFRRRGGRVAASPRRRLWPLQVVLLTHPTLDALDRTRVGEAQSVS